MPEVIITLTVIGLILLVLVIDLDGDDEDYYEKISVEDKEFLDKQGELLKDLLVKEIFENDDYAKRTGAVIGRSYLDEKD